MTDDEYCRLKDVVEELEEIPEDHPQFLFRRALKDIQEDSLLVRTVIGDDLDDQDVIPECLWIIGVLSDGTHYECRNVDTPSDGSDSVELIQEAILSAAPSAKADRSVIRAIGATRIKTVAVASWSRGVDGSRLFCVHHHPLTSFENALIILKDSVLLDRSKRTVRN